jgi:hypothetical protein
MLAVFEIIGGFVRYLLVNAFYKVVGKNETKKLSYFMDDKKGKMFDNLNNDYSNGIVGFITFSLILLGGYLLFN